MSSHTQLFNFVGTVVALKWFFDLLAFIHFHIQAPTVTKFKYGGAYALVTGATDGIGKATAKELAQRGFNLILHGRNPEKLQNVVDGIKRECPKVDIRLWLEDACRSDIDFESAVKQWEDLEITLVIHNVGGGPPHASTLDGVSESDLLDDVRRNALFPFLLTRAILPRLRKASGPAQMVYIGSYAGESRLPRLIPYGATKAFLKQMSGALGSDERFRNPSNNITTMYVIVGSVESGSHRVSPTFFSPTSETYAKSMVDKFGCGKRIIAPYLPHALQFFFVDWMPESIVNMVEMQSMEEELKMYHKN